MDIINGYDMRMGRRLSDEQDDDETDERTLRCKRCGSTDVRWRQQTGRWVLMSLKPGVEHRCDTSDDFGVVSE